MTECSETYPTLLDKLITRTMECGNIVLQAMDRLGGRPSLAAIKEATGLPMTHIATVFAIARELVEQLDASPVGPSHLCEGREPLCKSSQISSQPTECAGCEKELGDCYFVTLIYGDNWACSCGSRATYEPILGETKERGWVTRH